MSNRPSTSVSDLPHCPACQSPLMSAPDDRCPLCGFDFSEEDVINVDSTPFAERPRSYWRMLGWVVGAGASRLAYVGRMHASRASTWFVFLNLVWLALGGALMSLPGHGWVPQFHSGGVADTEMRPQGRGWKRIDPVRDATNPSPETIARMWWNPGLCAVAMGLSFFFVFAGGSLAVLLVRVGADLALGSRHRGAGRFSAAVHYHSAHMPLLCVAAALYASSVLQPIGEMKQWVWPMQLHMLPAVMTGGLAIFMAWFWWMRLAHSAPPDARGRMTWFFGLWAPALSAVLVGGWLYAQQWAMPFLAKELRMNF